MSRRQIFGNLYDIANSSQGHKTIVSSQLEICGPISHIRLPSTNTALLNTLNPDEVTVDIERAGEAEMDEMWSFVGRKTNPRWLWHAIDHQTGTVLAYVFGRRKDEVFLKLKALLDPFGLTYYYTDKWGAYTRHLDPEQHTVLFDAGPEGYAVERNGTLLGVSFGTIESVVLSHGYWDHAGGAHASA